MLTGLVATLFGNSVTDILSGYRVMSRRFVKSFPALSKGFEIETELTVHALDLRVPIAEVPTPYGARTAGSASKLNTWRDGWRILRTIARLVKEERPFAFFVSIGCILALTAIGLAVPLFIEFLRDGPGAARAHRHPVDWPHADRRHEFRLRADSRHRHPRPARTEANALSRISQREDSPQH